MGEKLTKAQLEILDELLLTAYPLTAYQISERRDAKSPTDWANAKLRKLKSLGFVEVADKFLGARTWRITPAGRAQLSGEKK